MSTKGLDMLRIKISSLGLDRINRDNLEERVEERSDITDRSERTERTDNSKRVGIEKQEKFEERKIPRFHSTDLKVVENRDCSNSNRKQSNSQRKQENHVNEHKIPNFKFNEININFTNNNTLTNTNAGNKLNMNELTSIQVNLSQYKSLVEINDDPLESSIMKVDSDFNNNDNNKITNNFNQINKTPTVLTTPTPVEKNLNVLNTNLNFTLADNGIINKSEDIMLSKRNKFGFDSSSKLFKKEEFSLNLLQTKKDNNDIDDQEMIKYLNSPQTVLSHYQQ